MHIMNIVKKILIAATLILVVVPQVYAEETSSSITPTVQTVPETRRYAQFKENMTEKRKNLLENLRDKVKGLKRVAIGTGEVTAVNGTTLTVVRDGKSYTVLTGTFEGLCTTKIVRHYFGRADLSEVKVGHTVNVYGRFQEGSDTTVDACLIRDRSIDKLHGVIIGTVTELTQTGWKMTTKRDPRGPQTVSLGENVKIVNRKMETIGKSDVQVGHLVRVKGVWDRTARTIDEVGEVKDFSLPLRAKEITPTAEPTATPNGT